VKQNKVIDFGKGKVPGFRSQAAKQLPFNVVDVQLTSMNHEFI
jgi:hypothetical protein